MGYLMKRRHGFGRHHGTNGCLRLIAQFNGLLAPVTAPGDSLQKVLKAGQVTRGNVGRSGKLLNGLITKVVRPLSMSEPRRLSE